MTMPSAQEIKEIIRHELPALLREDPNFRAWVLGLMEDRFADRRQTEGRFEQMLAELRSQREEFKAGLQTYREEWQAALREQRETEHQKWQAELKAHKDEQNHRLEIWEKEWHEKRNEDNRRWAANQEELKRLHEEIMQVARRHERAVGALGARWGTHSEATFRSALAGILEESFGVRVINVNEYDDQGWVFGRPDQVELDVIITNGMLILCEIKSSLSKSELYTFKRKAEFYERKHGRQANRLLAISPMIDPKARPVGQALGIEMFSDPSDVETL